MHSNREGIPMIFQAGSSYGCQIEWGDMDGGFWAFPAGFDSTPLFQGLPHGCECPHWGYLLKGRMRVKYADHEEVITAGEAYYLAPDHLPVMEEDCEMVEFSPKYESRKMLEFASRIMARSNQPVQTLTIKVGGHPSAQINQGRRRAFLIAAREKEINMNRIFRNVDIGRKNMVFGIALFLLLGVVVGIPLTIDLFGGSLLASDQYQTWKVVHGYGVFLAFINYFLGLSLDRLEMPRQQKEIVSWSFLTAGLIGGVIRMILVLMSSLNVLGIYASLGESVCFALGTIIFVRGQVKEKAGSLPERSAQTRYSGAR